MRIFITTIGLVQLIACESDKSLTIQNPAPQAEVISPDDGSEVLEGITSSFVGNVTDSNNPPEELVTTWYLGEDIMCDEVIPTSVGDSYCDFSLTEDSEITLVVRDPENARGEDSIYLSVSPTEAPAVSIISPNDRDNYYSDQKISFEGLISDAEDDVSELKAYWQSDIDGILSGADTTPDTQGSILGYEYLTEGQHAIELHVEDSTGKTSRESVIINVGPPNSTPLCEILSPLAGSVGIEGETTEFSASATDVDIENNQLMASWSSDKDGLIGTSQPTSAGNIQFFYDRLSINRHIITLEVSDEIGATCTSAIDYTIGSPPEVTIDSPTNGDIIDQGSNILFSATLSDAQDQPDDLLLDWSLNGSSISAQTANSSGTAEFSDSTLSYGSYSLILTATDSDGLTSSDQINFTINGIPSTPVISIQPNPASTSDNLLVNLDTPSLDPEGTAINYSYEWLLGGQVQTAYTNSILPSSATSKNEQWMVRVTPDDGRTTGTSATASITVQNTTPSISSVTITPISNTYNDVSYTCSGTASDPDETPTLSYQWSVNQTIVGTGTTLNGSSVGLLPNDVLACTLTATDSNNTTDSASAQITIANRAPLISATTITPNTGVTTSTNLNCSSQYSDGDGENLTPVYTWSAGGNTYNGSNLSLTPSIISPNNTVICTVDIADGYGSYTTDYASVIVNNINPVISAINITYTGTLTSTSLLTCSYSANDSDQETLTPSYTWRNLTTGSTLASASNSLQLSPSVIGANEVIECSVTVADPSGGLATGTASVSIGNTNPYFTMPATITTTGHQVGDSWICTAFGADQEDGMLTPSYIWKDMNGGLVHNGSTLVLSANNSNPNESITCLATIMDSAGISLSSSAAETVLNSLPSTPSISISPSSPTAGVDDLICNINTLASDPDAEQVVYTYEWYNSSGLQQASSVSALSNIFSGILTTPDTWSCDVYASDATGSTPTVSASVVVIGASSLGCSDHVSCSPDGYCAQWRVDSQFHCSDICNASADCGSGETCSNLPGSANARFCEPIPSNTLSASSSCTLDSQCEDGLCVNGYCESICGGELDCDTNESCHTVGYYPIGELYSSCSPSSNLADIGQACYGNGTYSGEYCETGHCDVHQYDGYFGSAPLYCRPLCSKESDCDLSGPFPEVCDIVVVGPTAPSNSIASVPNLPQPHSSVAACYEPWNVGYLQTGAACTFNSDCASNKCFNIMPNSTQRYCSAACETDSDCTAGTTCQTATLDVANEWMLYHSGYSTQSLQSTTTLFRVCAF